jgi:hypothetical protein
MCADGKQEERTRPSGERQVRSSVYARPSVSWPANRLRQMPDARMVRRERGVLTKVAASSA